MINIPDTRLMVKTDRNKWFTRWPSFGPYELDSDDWSLTLSMGALDALQRVRNDLGRPMRITCAYRNPAHNKRVGGKANSQHLLGTAFDIAVPDMDYAREVERLAIKHGFTAIGRYAKRHFIHIDMRPARADGKLARWPRGATWN